MPAVTGEIMNLWRTKLAELKLRKKNKSAYAVRVEEPSPAIR